MAFPCLSMLTHVFPTKIYQVSNATQRQPLICRQVGQHGVAGGYGGRDDHRFGDAGDVGDDEGREGRERGWI